MARQRRQRLPVAAAELQFRFLRARGPGGQNVNKVSSAVQLRFDLESSPSLSPDVKRRLRQLAGSRVNIEGALLITADSHRTQSANRREALARLAALIERAREVPKHRIATEPSRASRQQRLERKRHQQRTKALRRAPAVEE